MNVLLDVGRLRAHRLIYPASNRRSTGAGEASFVRFSGTICHAR